MTSTPLDIPEALVDAIRSARSIGVITGAGISVASGIAPYRGKGGVYDDPEEGDRTVEALSGPTLRNDPDRTWRALAKLALMAKDAKPNPGHQALVELEQRVDRFVLLTQNVDGLHEAAGSQNIIDIHGSMSRVYCMGCGDPAPVPDWTTLVQAPECAECHGVLRPDVVLFEEMLPEEKVRRMYEELLQDVPEAVIAVGTTAMFPYILEPIQIARSLGITTLEVNPEHTALSSIVEHHLQAGADVALPALVAAL
ncbi:MAG: NAD-dependent protein deacylase [Planctomycetes bacterium]|jgi:NAD-dependent deacetylase|nr:NAD-dependent protein deacylase [Planctomycetota bacterium]